MALFQQKDTIHWIPVEQLAPATHQPRSVFAAEPLKELSESIAAHGVRQPLLGRREEGRWLLIAGERRLRAAKMAGLAKVPCILTNQTAEAAARLSLIENLQREDLSFFEEAAAYRRLMEEFSVTQADLARELNKDPSTVANKLRLLRLPISAQVLIRSNGLSERHARALLKLKEPEQVMEVLEQILQEKLTVAETEELIQRTLTPKQKRKKPRRICSIKDIRLCINTLNHTVSTLKQAGIKPQTSITEEEGFVEYIIRIPKTS